MTKAVVCLLIVMLACGCEMYRTPTVSYDSEEVVGLLIVDESVCFFIPEKQSQWLNWDNSASEKKKAVTVHVDNLEEYMDFAIPMRVKYVPYDSTSNRIAIGETSKDTSSHEELYIMAVTAKVVYLKPADRTVIPRDDDTIRTAFLWEEAKYRYAYIWSEKEYINSFKILGIDSTRQMDIRCKCPVKNKLLTATDTVWDKLLIYADDFDADHVCSTPPELFDQIPLDELTRIEITNPDTIKHVFNRLTVDSLYKRGIDTRGKFIVSFHTSEVSNEVVFYLSQNYVYNRCNGKTYHISHEIYNLLKDRKLIEDWWDGH